MATRYVDINKVVEKYERQYDPTEFQNGVNNYTNDPDFNNLYTEQVNKAIQGYADAGAPEEWAAMQQLGLSMVSADEWKEAITSEETLTAYTNAKSKAVRKMSKKGIIFVEADNLVLDILDIANITDKENRMRTNYTVGIHFKKAVAQQLMGNTTVSDTELENLIKELDSKGIVDTYDDTSSTFTALGNALLQKAKDHRDNAVAYLQG